MTKEDVQDWTLEQWADFLNAQQIAEALERGVAVKDLPEINVGTAEAWAVLYRKVLALGVISEPWKLEFFVPHSSHSPRKGDLGSFLVRYKGVPIF